MSRIERIAMGATTVLLLALLVVGCGQKPTPSGGAGDNASSGTTTDGDGTNGTGDGAHDGTHDGSDGGNGVEVSQDPPDVDLPREAVRQFLEAISHGHVATALQFVVEDERDWAGAVMERAAEELKGARFQLLASDRETATRARVPVLIQFGPTVREGSYLCLLGSDGEWRVSFWHEWAGIRPVVQQISDDLSMHFLRRAGWNKLPGTYPLAEVAADFDLDVSGIDDLSGVSIDDFHVTLTADGHHTVIVRPTATDGPPGEYVLDDLGNETIPRR